MYTTGMHIPPIGKLSISWVHTLGRGLARTRSSKLARICLATSLRSRLTGFPSRDRGVGA